MEKSNQEKEELYLVITYYTPESEYESGVDMEIFGTLNEAKERAARGDRIYKFIEEIK